MARAAEVKALHEEKVREHSARADALDATANRVSILLLVVFLGLATLAMAALLTRNAYAGIAAGVVAALFIAMQIWHVRIHAKRDDAQARADVHKRHVARITGEWKKFPAEEHQLPRGHVYAYDIDLVGPGSLVQRIDVTHTRLGEKTLIEWLAQGAEPATIAARQEGVRELADNLAFREDLEAAARRARGDKKVDADLFLKFIREQPRVFATRPWLLPLMYVLPVASIATLVLAATGLINPWIFAGVLGFAIALNLSLSAQVHAALNLVTARKGYVDAFAELLRVIEGASFTSASLLALRQRMVINGAVPSLQIRRFETWASFAELRTQPPIYLPLNQLLLWDLHCLYRLEKWTVDVGAHANVWFEVIAELEALSSLAALLHQDENAIFPEIVASTVPFESKGIAHPLLQPEIRVANDVRLQGPGSALLITGSNMAGKSTLLRAVGQNIALALAGGPVCATSFTCPLVRLRASMRAEDSLQQGASYFRAELAKLESVIARAEDEPPVFFLLDELLRGTNASARHAGSRAIILHLLTRRGMGMVATHDTALASLEEEMPGRVTNAHFTDVVSEGEMTFDYALRQGVVKTSNALRLLKMAGVDVPEDALNSELLPSQKMTTKNAE